MPDDSSTDRRRFGAALRAVPGHTEGPRPARSYDTAQLFGGDTEVEIVHQQVVYRLKITRQGKLILNK
jgi:hemin uptake protein HemP